MDHEQDEHWEDAILTTKRTITQKRMKEASDKATVYNGARTLELDKVAEWAVETDRAEAVVGEEDQAEVLVGEEDQVEKQGHRHDPPLVRERNSNIHSKSNHYESNHCHPGK